jgi:hypothetical protein
MRTQAPARIGQPAPSRPSPTRRRLVWVAVLVLVALAVALAGALLRGPAEQPAPALEQRQAPTVTAGATAPAQPDASQQPFTAASAEAAFVAIQERRGEAFVKVDPSILSTIYTPTCQCLAEDQRSLQMERQRGYHLEQADFKVLSVKVVSLDRSTKSASLQATMRFGAGRYVDAQGNLRYVERARGPQTFRTILAWGGGRWRVAEVR